MKVWPEEKCCAISLSYDDAFESHWREVAPELEQRGFRGTFYTPIRSVFWEYAEEWKQVAKNGHELGNHTVFHPCRRPTDGPTYGVFDRYDLSRYSLDEFRNEIEVANAFLKLVDGRSQRTYGNTCHNMTVGRDDQEISITPVLQELFPAARGARRNTLAATELETLNLHEIGCVSSHSFADLKQSIDHAKQSGGWLVICLHDVADKEERLRIARSEHTALLDYLVQDSIWVAPVIDVALQLNKRTALS